MSKSTRKSKKKVDVPSIIRTIVLAVALINQFLASSGKSPLPFSDEDVATGASTAFTIAASIWTWWKNNYISETGLEQKEVLKENDLYNKGP